MYQSRFNFTSSDMEFDDKSNVLETIESERFKLYPVKEKCELSSLIVKHGLRYRIGCVYYEFARKEEDVSEDKHIILMDKVIVHK